LPVCSGISRVVAISRPSFRKKNGLLTADRFRKFSQLSLLYFMTGTCLTFFSMVLRSKAKTMSGVRSK
jgi:hypothetical protein